ncbi:MAG: LAGLIDADG family homing endonuclease [Nanoarchaeota archaeon]|nr:LAGLIDADG family homing endonuclease [Nanoarchaeota archaeon]
MNNNNNNNNNNLIIPLDFTCNLAEFVGIHFGDGSMIYGPNYKYRVAYACNLNEVDYVEYFQNLFYELFNIKLKKTLYFKKNCIELYYYSKKFCEYMINVLQVPSGRKTNLIIPQYIRSNRLLTIAFLRGLFDTDGCLTVQRDGKYKYLLAKITTSLPDFAYSISKLLKSLNIHCFVTKKGKHNPGCDVVIRHLNVIEFLNLVKPVNSKYYRKMGMYGATGTFGVKLFDRLTFCLNCSNF